VSENQIQIIRSYSIQPGSYSGEGYKMLYDQLAKVRNQETSNLLILKEVKE